MRRATRAHAHASKLVSALDRAQTSTRDLATARQLTRTGLRNLARDLARALKRARALNRNLDRSDDLARALDLVNSLYSARAFARAFLRSRSTDLADSDLGIVRFINLVSVRVSALADFDPDRGRDLAAAINNLRRGSCRDSYGHSDLVNTLDRACVSALADLDRARDLATEISGDLYRDGDLVNALALALEGSRGRGSTASGAGAVVAGGARSMPGRAASGLVALAVRLLPVAQRPRYREEFGVELVELPRRQRWGYALRVLASAWKLRKALGEAVRI